MPLLKGTPLGDQLKIINMRTLKSQKTGSKWYATQWSISDPAGKCIQKDEC